MTAKHRLLMLTALVCTVALVGCGGGGSSSTSTTSSTSSSTATKGAAGGLGSSEVATATRECEAIVASQAKLPATAKAKLQAACGKAAKGDTAAVKKAAREVCEEVIGKSALPAGAAKEAALSACKK